MGKRSQRYSMVVNDGVVEQLNVEAPGEYRASSAETYARAALALRRRASSLSWRWTATRSGLSALICHPNVEENPMARNKQTAQPEQQSAKARNQ